MSAAAGPTGVGRAATGMGAAAAVSRVLGGGRVLVVAAVLGTTFLGDAFEAANTLPTVVFELLAAGALSAVLVPTFTTLFDEGRDAEVARRAGGLLGVSLLVLGSLAVVGVIFSPAIAELLVRDGGSTELLAQRRALTGDLLRYFIPQLVLYPFGFLAIALLHARRSFVVPAAAPIANTVVLVSALIAFRVVAGADPGVGLTSGETLLLGLGGTLGVAGFVVVPVLALRRAGVRLRPRLPWRDREVGRLLRLSGWAVLQHTGGALLLGSAIVLGAATEGGVVSYRVAFYVFLAPYGILAQPIHTAVHPELAVEAAAGDLDAFGRSVRWGLDSLALIVIPVTAALIAVAQPAVGVVAFGSADQGDGVALMAAGTATLALGLFGYGGFRLLAGAWYALHDSRTPAMVAASTAVAGVLGMALIVPHVDGAAVVAVLGLGHSAAFTVGAVVLAVALHRRTGQSVIPQLFVRTVVVSGLLGVALWSAVEALDPQGRVGSAIAVGMAVALAAVLYGGVVRWRRWRPEGREPLTIGVA